MKKLIDLFDDVAQIRRMTAAQIRQRTLEKLEEQVGYAASHTSFYKERFGDMKLQKQIRSLEELQMLPYTTKADLRDAYPFKLLATDRNKVIRYGESTGTTGSPTSSFMTKADWDRDICWASISYGHYISSSDVVCIALPYELSFAAIATEDALLNNGATIISAGALNQICPWPKLVSLMERLNPSVIICTPTRALRLYYMINEAESSFGRIGLKLLFYCGEACSDVKRKRIEELLSVNVVTAYGTTETNSLALPCEYGFQHLIEDRFLFELIDPADDMPTHANKGELVLTSLMSEAMPLIRYRTGDIVSIDEEPCRCGLPFRRMKHYGRYSDVLRVSGQEVEKYDLEELILGIDGTGIFYVPAVEDGELRVYLDAEKNGSEVSMKVESAIMGKYGIKSRVTIMPRERLFIAMDKKLKPGTLTLNDLREIL